MSPHRTDLVEESALVTREAQLVLPAVLLLFVFQIGFMTNPVFAERLTAVDIGVAFASLGVLGVGAAGLFTPSMYGRSQPRKVTRRTLLVGRRATHWPLLAVSVKFASDVYLEARVVTRAWLPSIACGVAVLLVFVALQVVLPAVARRDVR